MWKVLATAITGLILSVIEWLKVSQAKQEGADIEAAKVAVVTAKAEVAIAQAAEDAPDTKAEVIDRLKKGTF